MKRFISFLALFAVAATTFTGCDDCNARSQKRSRFSILDGARRALDNSSAQANEEEQPFVEHRIDEPEQPVLLAKTTEAKPQVAPVVETKVEPKPAPVVEKKEAPKPKPTPVAEKKAEPNPKASSGVDFDKMMQKYGLVDIRTLDKNILVELKYSTTDNFVGKDMYGSLERAYLEPNFAKRVLRAQKILRKRYPNYTLLIYDAARPISVQRTMRKMVEGTEFQSFVADGTKGGRHNYGVAVDVTIADSKGRALDMGTGFDSFDKASAVKGTSDNSDPTTRTIEIYRAFVRNLQAKKLISKEAADNRILLLEVMYEAGLYPYRNEWWHFELIDSMAKVRNTYRLLDF